MTRLTLAPTLTAAGAARRFVAQRCAAAGVADDLRDVAVLLTSEVVANAVVHGRSEARVAVDVRPDVVHVEVADDNSRHPQLQDEDTGALDGRGLHILALLSRRWGVRDDAVGKVVWFEVATTGPPTGQVPTARRDR